MTLTHPQSTPPLENVHLTLCPHVEAIPTLQRCNDPLVATLRALMSTYVPCDSLCITQLEMVHSVTRMIRGLRVTSSTLTPEKGGGPCS